MDQWELANLNVLFWVMSRNSNESTAQSSNVFLSPETSQSLHPAELVFRKRPRRVDNTYTENHRDTFKVSSSVIPAVWLPVAIYTIWSTLVSVLVLVLNVKTFAVNPLIITILSVVMGLLLVFRTNTAYDRFWEARRLWGTLFTHTRILGRFFWVAVRATTPEEKKNKQSSINMLLAYAVACKHTLRDEHGIDYADLHPLVSHIPHFKQGALHEDEHIPLAIAAHLSTYIQQTRSMDQVDVPTTASMIVTLNGLVDCMSNFERIRATPIPRAYSIHLRQTLMLYIAALPFQLVNTMGWATIPVTFIASFTLLGILAIAGEIENPFGYDANDLRLEDFCEQLRTELIQLMSRDLTSSVQTWGEPMMMSCEQDIRIVIPLA